MNWIAALILVLGTLISSVSQVMLKKAAQRVPASSLMTVSGAKGSVSYSKVSVNKRSGSFSVDPATGNVYIKKKTKKGTYRIQIQVTASGDSEYNAGSSTVTCSIKVK